MGADLAPGTIVGGDHRVVSLLARGGMGAVYVSEQLSTGRTRALKILRRDLLASPGMAERFTLEARVAARIRSDHVVEVIAAGFDPVLGVPWLSMELLEGRSLDAILSARGRLSLAEASELLRQVGAGLAAAHQAGVVHRDLKPENVFVAAQRDASRAVRVKILDFGIAKVLAEASAASPMTVAVGTPRWMSPEQTESTSTVSPASDVWAFGLLAYAVLTGRYFWRAATAAGGTTITQLLREVLADPIPAASHRAAEQGVGAALPPGFDPWLARCLDRDPQRRFPTAAEASAALAPLLGPGHLEATILLGAGQPGGISPVVPTFPAVTGAPVTGPGRGRAPSKAGPIAAGVAGGLAVLALGAGLTLHFVFDAFSPERPERPREAPVLPAVDGVWTITAAAAPNGVPYRGQVSVSPLGPGKRLSWTLHTGEKQEGIGILSPTHLDVAWGIVPYAVAVYSLEGDRLRGRILEGGAPHEIHTEELRGAATGEGTYQITASSRGATGTVQLTRDGPKLLAARSTALGQSHGVGLREGNRIVVAFSPTGQTAGVVVYSLDPAARSMRGLWALATVPQVGREDLSAPEAVPPGPAPAPGGQPAPR